MTDLRDTRVRRKAIPKSVRFRVMKRDDFKCVYCGATADDDKLVIDHAQSLADAGRHDASNFVTACETCNAGKGRTSVSRAIKPLPPVPAPIRTVAEQIYDRMRGGIKREKFLAKVEAVVTRVGERRALWIEQSVSNGPAPDEDKRRLFFQIARDYK